MVQEVHIDYQGPGGVPGRCQEVCLLDVDDLERDRCCSKNSASRRHQTVNAADFLSRRSGQDKDNISCDTRRSSKCDLGHEPCWCREFNKVLCHIPTPSLQDESCFREYSKSTISVTVSLHEGEYRRACGLFLTCR